MATPVEAPSTSDPTSIITAYLRDHSSIFGELDELRKKGWTSTEADAHFQKQRKRADEAGPAQQKNFFNMMCHLGDEMQKSTGAIALSKSEPAVLDLCAAPGGFIATALKHNPDATVCGITLDKALGGHPLLVPHGGKDRRVAMLFLDINTLGIEPGLDAAEITSTSLFVDLPFFGQSFDLVFCDGKLLRTHFNYQEDRRDLDAQRLAFSQLIIALQRTRQGGTLIMLLHKVETWHTLQILHAFSKFADLRLFKPERIHGNRSSFYMIATNVQPTSEAAQNAVEEWKGIWKEATLAKSSSTREERSARPATEEEEEVRKVLDDFGERVIELAEPIWGVQKAALSKQPWTQ
ncbi:hypothetical protein H2200_007340 [Cladophialophora chaetospira]|uniref:Ribosomal RNA methyltransferase FtsJ domain-containing protein n=1 Tax=Cladophialophora chaetospira TaxID=386627 RepID=A0AA39CHF3_9EURO|nr:hypothetical protein H2200_007340 [Cladophialophora chaetospira]